MAAHIKTEQDNPAQIKTEQDSPAQIKIEHDSPAEDNFAPNDLPQDNPAQETPGQDPLDVFTLPGVNSLRRNEWANVEYKNEWRYRGVLVFDLKLSQDPATVIDRKDPITVRVLVLRMSKSLYDADSKFVTYREETTAAGRTKPFTYRGAPTFKYTGRGEDFKAPTIYNVHWCDGMRTDCPVNAEAREQDFLRRDLKKRIARVINIEDQDWDDVEWGELKKQIDFKANLEIDIDHDNN